MRRTSGRTLLPGIIGVLACLVGLVVVAPPVAGDPAAPRVLGVAVSGGGADAEDVTRSQVATHLGYDEVRVEFTDVVRATAGDLTVLGGRRTPEIAGFSLSGSGTVGTWELAQPLADDSYLLVLSDTVTNTAGTSLDGEWGSQTGTTSGNGLPGGDLRFGFDVRVGDVNGDRSTDVRDYAQVLDAPGSTPADLAEVRSALGSEPAPLAPGQLLQVVGLGDDDGDGVDELAVLQEAPTPAVVVTESDKIAPLWEIQLPAAFRYIALTPIAEPGVAATWLAVLGVSHATGGVRVWAFPRRGGPARTWSLGRGEIPHDLVGYTAGGAPVVAVLGQVSGSTRYRIRTVDAQTGDQRSASVAVGFEANRLRYDAASRRLLLPGVMLSSGASRLHVIEPSTLARVGSVPVGEGQVLDVGSYADPATGSPRYVLLRPSAGPAPNVEVRRPNGSVESRPGLPPVGTAVALAGWEENGSPRVGVLGLRPGSNEATFAGIDATGANPFVTGFGAGRRVTSLAVVGHQGAVALAVAGQATVIGGQQVQVRRAEGNQRIRTVPLAGSPRAGNWFLDHLVHGHTRYYPYHPTAEDYYGTDGYEHAGRNFAQLGARLFTRSARHYDEDPIWPSEVPTDAAGNQQFLGPRTVHEVSLAAMENPVQRTISEAWAHGEPMLGYYNDMSEAGVAQAHPGWVCEDSAGQDASHVSKGLFLDVTGPYSAVVRQRLLELADMGAAGAMLDFRHLPVGGCYGSALASAYEAEFGVAPPPGGPSEGSRRWLGFNADRLTQTVDEWRAALGAEYPDFQVLVSATTLPGLTRLEMNNGLATNGSTKSEFSVATAPGMSNSVFIRNPDLAQPADSLRKAFGYALLRDSSATGTTQIWKPPSPTAAQDRSFIAAVTTFAAAAALDAPEELLAGGAAPWAPSHEDFASTFRFGDRLSPALAGLQPLGQAAVVFSDRARAAHHAEGDRVMWEESNLPTLGGFQALSELGLSPSVITDSQLTSGVPGSVQVLWVPEPGALTTAQRARVDAYAARGGQLLENDLDWASDADYAASVGTVTQRIERERVQVRVDDLPEGAMSAAYIARGADRRVTISLTNDFSHVQISTRDAPLSDDEVAPPPDPVPAGVVVTVEPALLGVAGVDEVFAWNPISGDRLDVSQSAAGALEITLPAFQELAQVEIIRR